MKNILIVSTDQAIIKTFNSGLVWLEFNFNLKTLRKADELYQHIGSFAPDVLIIDFMLNDTNGGMLCRELKSDPGLQNLPIILLTEHPELKRFSKKFGCEAMLCKPLQLDELEDTLQALTHKDERHLDRAS